MVRDERVFECFSVTGQVVIRTCAASDLADLEWHGSFSPHRAIIAEAFARHERGEVLMLVAEAAGFPVGQIWIDFVKAGPDTAVLWAFRVIRGMGGLGIGTRLIDVAEQTACGRGFGAAEVGCERSNDSARRFYERRGYTLARAEIEHYAYTTPEGVRVHATSDMWILHKPLARLGVSHERAGAELPRARGPS